MGFLRRIFGGSDDTGDDGTAPGRDEAREDPPVDPDAEERQHELEVLRSEAERLDELAQRQLKYAGYAWRPPDEGGERRADDTDESSRA
jgi:hypothetical protein